MLSGQFLERTKRILGIRQRELNAEARVIFDRALDAFHRIVDERAAMNQRGALQKNLHVFIGENHSKPSHKLFFLTLMALLDKHGYKTGFAFEWPHNHLRNAFNAIVTEGDANSFQARWREVDKEDRQNGRLSLAACICAMYYAYADFSKFNLLYYCLLKNIHTILTDVAAVEHGKDDATRFDPVIDFSDQSSRHSMGVYYAEKPATDISFVSNDGFEVRNHMMIKRLLNRDRMSALKGGVVLVNTGTLHLFGNVDEFDTDRTLERIAHERGLSYLTMPLVSDVHDRACVNDDMIVDPSKLLWIDGLSDTTAVYNPITNKSFDDRETDIKSVQAEAAYFNSLMMMVDQYSAECFDGGSLGLSDHIVEAGDRKRITEEIYDRFGQAMYGDYDALMTPW